MSHREDDFSLEVETWMVQHSCGDNELDDKQTQVNTEHSFMNCISRLDMKKGNLWNRLYILYSQVKSMLVHAVSVQ